MSVPLPIVEARGCRVMSLSLVSLKARRVEELMYVKSAGNQTASRWCGVENGHGEITQESQWTIIPFPTNHQLMIYHYLHFVPSLPGKKS
ncbi:hypothetical protein TNCV_1272661 [Trichonephila clavipes]|nr:hypothetical protein TNCV_1272661 [Trichonephila clavipes]